MKKCAFLGKHTWWVTSVLFALYHPVADPTHLAALRAGDHLRPGDDRA